MSNTLSTKDVGILTKDGAQKLYKAMQTGIGAAGWASSHLDAATIARVVNMGATGVDYVGKVVGSNESTQPLVPVASAVSAAMRYAAGNVTSILRTSDNLIGLAGKGMNSVDFTQTLHIEPGELSTARSNLGHTTAAAGKKAAVIMKDGGVRAGNVAQTVGPQAVGAAKRGAGVGLEKIKEAVAKIRKQGKKQEAVPDSKPPTP